MRLPCLLPFVPMALVAQVLPLPEAEAQYLEAWDLGTPTLAMPRVARPDQPAFKWLVAAASQTVPANPFPRGGGPWREAESLRSYLQSKPERWASDLKALPLSLSGSYLALWRWGQQRVREGRIGKTLRQQWEDKLLAGMGPLVVRDSALRHALCFALDAGDGLRFARLKEDLEEDFPDTFPKFQNAFALLGAPAPVVQLWSLPGLEPLEVSLGQLGGTRVRLEADPVKGLPELAADTVWVVPTTAGSQSPASAVLQGESLAEAELLLPRLVAAGRRAYLAPVRATFEAYALMYFPIELQLDAQGGITRIRMGDAALARPAQPTPAP
jgi:hypothetical protein